MSRPAERPPICVLRVASLGTQGMSGDKASPGLHTNPTQESERMPCGRVRAVRASRSVPGCSAGHVPGGDSSGEGAPHHPRRPLAEAAPLRSAHCKYHLLHCTACWPISRVHVQLPAEAKGALRSTTDIDHCCVAWLVRHPAASVYRSAAGAWILGGTPCCGMLPQVNTTLYTAWLCT